MAINISGTTITFNDATTQTTAAVPGGDYILTTFTSSGTWTKPAGLKAVKVTVIGAGGNGGAANSAPEAASAGGNGGGGGGAIEYLDAPAIPGPVTVTVGTAPSKTSSFGPFVSATGGTNGAGSPSGGIVNATAAGGVGSGGQIDTQGEDGRGANGQGFGFTSGGSAFGFASGVPNASGSPGGVTGANGRLYGGGALGGIGVSSVPRGGGTGAAGIVIVEEFY
jgi:hypothetical protein